jgi:hypothetical protein
MQLTAKFGTLTTPSAATKLLLQPERTANSGCFWQVSAST